MGRETRAHAGRRQHQSGALLARGRETLWKRKDGAAGVACSGCHDSMKGVAARYPAVKGRLVNLEQQINVCRIERQKAAPLAYESRSCSR